MTADLRAFAERLYDVTFAAFSTPEDRAAIESEAANDALLLASHAIDFPTYVAALATKYQAWVIDGLPPEIAAHVALLAFCFTALELDQIETLTGTNGRRPPVCLVVGPRSLTDRISRLEAEVARWKAIACN